MTVEVSILTTWTIACPSVSQLTVSQMPVACTRGDIGNATSLLQKVDYRELVLSLSVILILCCIPMPTDEPRGNVDVLS
jgi:hypothetical protein